MDEELETSNWLQQDTVEIMPKTEGSGQEGTAELLSVATPLLAAANLTPIGRGVGAAIATIATIPQDSEAGIFKILGRTKIPSLTDNGASVFPDMTRNVEFPTSSFAKKIQNRKGLDVKTLADEIEFPSWEGMSLADEQAVVDAKRRMEQIPAFTRNEAKMLQAHGVTESTNAFYTMPTESLPLGKVVLKRSGKNNEAVPFSNMAGSATHEFTHSNDVVDPIMDRIFGAPDLDYNLNLTESRAFISGFRHDMPKPITSPYSPDYLHPMLGYADGVVSTAPAIDYLANMKHSFEAIGKEVDMDFAREYFGLLNKEAARVQFRIDSNPEFRVKLDKAVDKSTANNMAWNLTVQQKKALGHRQVEANVMKQREEMQMKARVDAFNKANPEGVTYTEPGYKG